jgi:cold shock CspA family protein
MRRNGVVTRYGSSRGFGFILELGEPQSRVETHAEVFFDAVNVVGRIDLCAGDRVTFELGHAKPGSKLPAAIRVQLVDSPESAARR